MSRMRSVALILSLTGGLAAGFTGPSAQAYAPSCSGFTVHYSSAADVPDGVSTRALMEGLNYPHMCR